MPSTRRLRATMVPIRPPAESPARLPVDATPLHPFDRRYGTDTGGLISRNELLTGHANDEHITAYYAVAPSILDRLLDTWLESHPARPIDRWTFLDVGAGKGRALMAASLHPFAAVVGVEANPALVRIALANLRLFAAAPSAAPLSPAMVVEGDALELPLADTPTLAFLFHPFEAPVLRAFAERAATHFRRGGAPFDLLYVNAEHSSVLDDDVRFRRVFHGRVAMSPEDHVADLAEIAGQTEYGSTGDELCSIFRLLPPVGATPTGSRRPRRPQASSGSGSRAR